MATVRVTLWRSINLNITLETEGYSCNSRASGSITSANKQSSANLQAHSPIAYKKTRQISDWNRKNKVKHHHKKVVSLRINENAWIHTNFYSFHKIINYIQSDTLRGSATQNRLIFQLCFIMPKINLYVCRILCENFIQIGQKMKKL